MLALPLLIGERCLGAMAVELKYREASETDFFNKIAAAISRTIETLRNHASAKH